MRTQADRVPSLLLLVGAIVAILLGTSGFAAVTSWMPASNSESRIVFRSGELPTPPVGRIGALAPPLPAPREGDTQPTVRCAGCGVIAFMREIQQPATGIDFRGESTRTYEVTIRMNDGSRHVFMDSKPATWHPGQRVILVEGKSNLPD